MSDRRMVRLTITKVYDFVVNSDDVSQAKDKCELVAHRRLVKNLKKIEGELEMKEMKSLERWSWKVSE
jgi:hypothetical protein